MKMTKKKLKVRVPSKFLKRAVKAARKKKIDVPFGSPELKTFRIRAKREVDTNSEVEAKKKKLSTLSKLKQLVRVKNKAKVHPIVPGTED